MENSNQYLLEIVDEQQKTIEKYTSKLRDVVSAHKSLLREKKVLEDTIQILNKTKVELDVSKPENLKNENRECKSYEELKHDLNSLLVSFSNLVAEKSHMEECYKTNQKQLLEDKEIFIKKCRELEEQNKSLYEQLKSKDNKNKNEFGFIKKDFKKFSKNNKQETLQEDKLRSNDEILLTQIQNYEREIKNLKCDLEEKKLNQELSEKKLKETFKELNKVKDEIRILQIEHEMAIQQEKEKTKDVEDNAKKLTAVQEERVINLETRLAELSETIGSYDRLRLQDQMEIQKLKEHIAFIDTRQKIPITDHKSPALTISDDFDTALKQFVELKKQLQVIALKCGKETEFIKNLLYDTNSYKENIHSACKKEYSILKAEVEFYKNEIKSITNQSKSGKDILVQQNQVKNLQEKIRILNSKNKEIEKEYKAEIEQLKKVIQNEKVRYKETLAAVESDQKARIWLLEEQLQKQRERFVVLLEEKEQEINSLQCTFQMFLPGCKRQSEEESVNDSWKLMKIPFVDGPHIVHYANELARKDIEISSLRKSKHQIEMDLRETQKELASAVEKHKEEKKYLKEENLRLERCQTKDGANLEYLKNVVFIFLTSNDPKSKQHMCNAIAAVLKFSESELQKVVHHNKNSWWTRSNVLKM